MCNAIWTRRGAMKGSVKWATKPRFDSSATTTSRHRLRLAAIAPPPSRSYSDSSQARPWSASLEKAKAIAEKIRSDTHNTKTYDRDGDLVLSDAQRRTIYALSTPPGKAGVAVIRISGPEALDVWRSVVRPYGKKERPEPWKMEKCKVVNPKTGETLDDGLAVFFKAPKSFTTQDVLELHIHSGKAILQSVLQALSLLPYCRPAEPGEFTRRAFESGRLDLTQVEGLKDLVDAQTESQRRVAVRTAGGETRARFETLRAQLIHCLAMVEALIDFGEGEEIEEGVYENARAKAREVKDTIQGYLSDTRRGEMLRSGVRLAIFGPPNAGKSSLLNFLVQREAAIVTSVAGTTRDVMEVSVDLGGVPVVLADTAGVRETEDVVERIGVERAREMVRSADVSLCVLSLPDVLAMVDDMSTQSPSDAGADDRRLEFQAQETRASLNLRPGLEDLIDENTMFLLNKSDLIQHPVAPALLKQGTDRGIWSVSLSDGQGTKAFLDGLTGRLKEKFDMFEDSSAQAPLITHERHRRHLESALKFVDAFLDTPAEDVVLGAEELRYAAQAVGKVSGLIDVEDVLDAVFRDFCIGK